MRLLNLDLPRLDLFKNPVTTMRGIHIVPIGVVDPAIVDFLSFALSEFFMTPCRVRREDIGLEAFYCPERRQHHSTELLRNLTQLAADGEEHILGIVDVDLYIPILTFVYGEAQLGNRCALMSTHRLHQQFYGLPEDKDILLRRSEKEAVHELGHTLGLTHCKNIECAMYYSSSIGNIDIKRNVLCPECSKSARLRSLW